MAIITVGPGGEFGDLSGAVRASAPGDEIRILQSLEVGSPVETPHALRIVGTGARPVLTFRGLCPGFGGILMTRGETFVGNIEFRDARALTGNGAGVWHLQGGLEISDCVFSHNQNGLMVASGMEDATRVSGCSFVGNGAGCGHTHGIYASGGRLEVERCSFEDTRVGHHLKSRAAQTRVVGNYFGGSPDATTSYAVDVSNGGVAEVSHNLMIKGRGSMSRKFVTYGAEKPRHAASWLVVRSNIFISHRRDPAVAVVNFAPGVPAVLRDNAYEGRVVPLLGRGRDRRRMEAGTAITVGAAGMAVGEGPSAQV